MYGIFTNIYPINDPNVGKYTIHGAYGIYIYISPKIFHKIPVASHRITMKPAWPWPSLGRPGVNPRPDSPATTHSGVSAATHAAAEATCNLEGDEGGAGVGKWEYQTHGESHFNEMLPWNILKYGDFTWSNNDQTVMNWSIKKSIFRLSLTTYSASAEKWRHAESTPCNRAVVQRGLPDSQVISPARLGHSIHINKTGFLEVRHITLKAGLGFGDLGILGLVAGDKYVDVDTVPSGKRLHSELENHHFSWENPLWMGHFQ